MNEQTIDENFQKTLKAQLDVLVQGQILKSFVPEYQGKISREDGLGILISKYLFYDGSRIIETAISALEDSNFHREVEILRLLHREMTNKEELVETKIFKQYG